MGRNQSGGKLNREWTRMDAGQLLAVTEEMITTKGAKATKRKLKKRKRDEALTAENADIA